MKITLLILVSPFILLPSAFPQGSLTPPGTPLPTMKTLSEIEPRTNLQATPAPPGVDTTNANYAFIITQPGSYYLSANIGVTKTNGIQINAAGVTLDLNGFEISRASGTGGNGIEITGTSHRASVRNGSLKGFADGIQSLAPASGFARACAFRDLGASNCTSYGILAGNGAVLESCRAHDNGGIAGIYATAGSTLTNCTASNNTTSYGIYASSGSSLTNCSAYKNQSSGNTSAGIGTGSGCTITHCAAYNNLSTAATSTPTTGMGFDVGTDSAIQDCTAYSNQGDGINLSSDAVARDNTCVFNGSFGDGAGIHATSSSNRIEGNNVTRNDRGIDVDAGGNLIIKNSASGNTVNNYDIVADNRYGQIFDITAAGTAAVTGNSSPTNPVGTTNPWANFTY